MTLSDLNKSLLESAGKITMTDMEVIYKVLMNDPKFKEYLKSKHKPKSENATINYQKAFLNAPKDDIQLSIVDFIKNHLGIKNFNTTYAPILNPLRIYPAEWVKST
ncbi:MAG: hypothetical protein DRH57_09435 [Candidatus Cloacimonadota bacterium]|nr:MAG: hypothetical protein DRH57_09435 [Candidatus Cloacimonadota bacterium]